MTASNMPSIRPLPLQHLLETYTTSHPLRSPSPLPPSSRVDPELEQRLPPASSASPLLWTLPTWWLFIRFVFTKGIHVFVALLCHFLLGPKRASWGYRMTFMTSFMRNIADHSSLADIVLIRRFIALHFLVPLPEDAVITPITFTVPRRKDAEVARGFMRQWDLAESGTRELSGEWVVGTGVWKRLKAERRARQRRQASSESNSHRPRRLENGSRDLAVDVESRSVKKTKTTREKVIYYIHGGAYYVGNAATHRLITISVSKSCNARVFAITYRLAPENVFPLPLHDVLHGYLRLLSPPLSISPENIVIAGDSAGGGLSLALCMYLRDEGYKLPAGLVLMSPWVDLTMSCGSWDENSDSDVVPFPEADDHLNPVYCYLGPKGIKTYLTHPYASPLFGDFHGLPPILIQSGDSEVLRDENTLLAHKATLAGVEVTHELYEDMIHVFQMFSFLPATNTAINNVGRWVRHTLPKLEKARREAGREQGDVGRLDLDVANNMEKEMDQGGPRLVYGDGQEMNVPAGRTEVLPQELDAARDGLRRSMAKVANLYSPHNIATKNYQKHQSTASSPSDSSSGSPTPTNSRLSSPQSPNVPFPSQSRTPTRQPAPFIDSDSHLRTLPRLRRTQTSSSTPFNLSLPSATQTSSTHRRHPTATSIYVTPSAVSSISSPVSPSSSIRRRFRSGTLSFQPHPTTRTRSKSHSDIFNLVEGYVEGGAANETTVYAPGGEIRSVGVLGQDDEDGENGF
ncbi:hypothetical protein L204_103364 [Cryptococcus depauperatus]|nr:esterase [Cryptococcus depauperatus CBS 7855]